LEKFLINSKNILLNESEIIFDDEKFSYEFQKLSENLNFIRVNGYNFILNSENENGSFYINYNGKKFEVDCKNSRDLIREKLQGGENKKKYSQEIKSPMPGAIVKITVEEGVEIKKGDVLLVLEAMKMENEIKATHDCKVKKILVNAKDNVEKGQVLIIFE